jgi:hypothetical protein
VFRGAAASAMVSSLVGCDVEGQAPTEVIVVGDGVRRGVPVSRLLLSRLPVPWREQRSCQRLSRPHEPPTVAAMLLFS